MDETNVVEEMHENGERLLQKLGPVDLIGLYIFAPSTKPPGP